MFVLRFFVTAELKITIKFCFVLVVDFSVEMNYLQQLTFFKSKLDFLF